MASIPALAGWLRYSNALLRPTVYVIAVCFKRVRVKITRYTLGTMLLVIWCVFAAIFVCLLFF